MSSAYDVHTPLAPYASTGKVIYALWGDTAKQALLDPALHRQLAEAGASHLQVNVDDEPVSEAMRIPTGEPMQALAAIWAEPEASVVSGVTDALREIADRVAGWAVAERQPLAFPQAWDGSRLDGLANVALLRRPAELDEATWRHRWLIDHTPIAIETQATFGYVQNLVSHAVTDDSPKTHAIVEELFPSAGVSDMHAFYGSCGDDAELESRLTRLMTSVGRIGADKDLDLVPSSRYLFALTAPAPQ